MHDLLHDLVTWLAKLSVPITLFSIGLSSARFEYGYFRRHARLALGSLVSTLVLVPLLMLVAARLLPLDTSSKYGLAMLAIAPGAPFASRKALHGGGHPIYTSHLILGLGLATLVTTPLSLVLLGSAFGQAWSVEAGAVLKTVSVSTTIPLLLGVAVRSARPQLARALERSVLVVSKLAFAALGLACVALLFTRARVLLTLPGLGSVGLYVPIALAALGVGHALGGPEPGTRQTLAIYSAMRNPGLALLLAKVNFPTLEVLPPILGYVIATALAAFIYQRIKQKRTLRPSRPSRPIPQH